VTDQEFLAENPHVTAFLRAATDEEVAEGWGWRPAVLVVRRKGRLYHRFLPLALQGEVTDARVPIALQMAIDALDWSAAEWDRRWAEPAPLFNRSSPSAAVH
jgi:hypothetical protein